MKKQGSIDPLLNEKLAELKDDLIIQENGISEINNHLAAIQKNSSSLKKNITTIDKGTEKYHPQSLDNIMVKLDEFQD